MQHLKVFSSAVFMTTALLASTSAVAVQPSNTSALIGTWHNVNPSTRSTIKIVVKKVGSNLKFTSYGSCSPTPCVHTTVKAIPFSNKVTSNYARGFTAKRNSGFKSSTHTAVRDYSIDGGKFMRMTSAHTFASGDKRKDYMVVELFRK